MSVGTAYTHQSKKQAEQVLLATAAHQCFSLAMSLLGMLPPSYRVLSAMVEGEGLSLMVSRVGWKIGLSVITVRMSYNLIPMTTPFLCPVLFLHSSVL